MRCPYCLFSVVHPQRAEGICTKQLSELAEMHMSSREKMFRACGRKPVAVVAVASSAASLLLATPQANAAPLLAPDRPWLGASCLR